MLLVGGSDALTGLQTITIVAALPFVLVMVGLAVALVKDLRQRPDDRAAPSTRPKRWTARSCTA